MGIVSHLDAATGVVTQRSQTPAEITQEVKDSAKALRNTRQDAIRTAFEDDLGMWKIVFRMLLGIHNRVRVLEGQPQHTLEELKQRLLADNS